MALFALLSALFVTLNYVYDKSDLYVTKSDASIY
jgi:hypothetical protein